MAVAIPIAAGYMGATAGAAVAAGMGLGVLGSAVVASVGASLVTAAVSDGGIGSFFDDPEAALTSIAVGTFMGYAGANFSNVQGAQSVNGAEMAGGVSAGAEATGTMYDGMANSLAESSGMMSDALGDLTNAQAVASASSGTTTGIETSIAGMDRLAGEEMFSQVQALNIEQANQLWTDSIASVPEGSSSYLGSSEGMFSDFSNIDYSPQAPAPEVSPGISGLSDADYLSDPYLVSKTRGMEAQNYNFAPTGSEDRLALNTDKYGIALETDKYGVAGTGSGDMRDPFDLEKEFETTRTQEEEEDKKADKKRMRFPELYQRSAMPSFGGQPGINTDTGNIKNLQGLSGQLDENDLYNNPITRPMMDAYQKQQQKAASIAQKTWGLLNTTRTKGLMS